MMASGAMVWDWWNRAAACPYEFPFGTIITLYPGGEQLVCKDRFSKIYVYETDPTHPSYGYKVGYVIPGTNYFWLDMLSKDSPLPHGAQVKVNVQFPS